MAFKKQAAGLQDSDLTYSSASAANNRQSKLLYNGNTGVPEAHEYTRLKGVQLLMEIVGGGAEYIYTAHLMTAFMRYPHNETLNNTDWNWDDTRLVGTQLDFLASGSREADIPGSVPLIARQYLKAINVNRYQDLYLVYEPLHFGSSGSSTDGASGTFKLRISQKWVQDYA